jgi:hypothetical protein
MRELVKRRGSPLEANSPAAVPTAQAPDVRFQAITKPASITDLGAKGT